MSHYWLSGRGSGSPFRDMLCAEWDAGSGVTMSHFWLSEPASGSPFRDMLCAEWDAGD
ncbi:hypothetical protein QE430_001445 [Microbacterium testaceum]|nr:hypothetical protein [Microbacterium testaceum]